MSNGQREKNAANRKVWKAPVLRAIVPAKRTAGGPFGGDDQESLFYSVS